MISDQPMKETLRRRPLLEALGLNPHDVLAAAPDRFGGTVCVNDILQQEGTPETVLMVCVREGAYRAESEAESEVENSKGDDNARCDHATESKEEWTARLESMLR